MALSSNYFKICWNLQRIFKSLTTFIVTETALFSFIVVVVVVVMVMVVILITRRIIRFTEIVAVTFDTFAAFIDPAVAFVV